MNSFGNSGAGLVIGAGSIGMQHAARMAKRYASLVIVDPLADARERAQAAHPGAVVVSTLDEALSARAGREGSVTAVIANWGPDHADTFHHLADAGVRRILCEKPMVHRVEAAWTMVRRAERDGIRLGVNLPRRYSGLVPFLRQTAAQSFDGPITSIVVHGGAQCLITMGVHWLDLAAAIFGAAPTGVTARVRDGGINPRSPALGYWEGTAAWDFPDGRSFSMMLTNGSSVSAMIHLYGRNGRIDLHPDGSVSIGRRREEEVQRFPRITRTGKVVPEVVALSGLAADPTSLQLDELDGEGPLTFTPNEAASTLEAALAALWASEAGIHVELPLAETHPGWAREWPAS